MEKVTTKHLLVFVLLGLFIAVIVSSNGGDCGNVCSVSAETQIQDQVIENIAVGEAATLIEENRENSDFVILDVRTPEEFAAGHLEGAINIDFYGEAFKDHLNSLDKDKSYLIYCRTARRTGEALKIMETLDFAAVYNMLGGIVQWEAEGLPTTI
ncbi:MAG: rhodanese-like domain-containing protein [Chloroflexota bacterium]|nr:rhodanese-like domain-containing protein [Chloroflexota bacterium]